MTIPAGTYDGTSATAITVPLGIIDDSIVEADETVIITLSNPGVGFSIGDANGDASTQNNHTYTITNDDTAGITISDVSAAEGNTAGTTDFIFTVTLDAADPDDDILIDYTTTNGTATAGSDYTAASGTLTFAANTATLTQQITVTVTGDDVVEANETFTLDLSLNTANTGSAVISDAQGLGTILDDDTAGITISDVSAAEGNTAGTTDFIFTVTLDAADPDDDILIDYTTTNGTATAGSDYTAASGTLTFAANTATLTQQITVTVTGDDVVEANETFTLDLSLNTANTGSAVISDAQGLGTILDDDTAGITISDVSAAEGNTAGTTDFIFTVTLDAADPDDDILIDYTTTNGTATAGSDYTAASGTLTFAANTATLTQQITVTVTGDDVVEANETFTLDLSLNTANTGSAVISDAQGLGTILDDDTAGITISDVSAAEGNTAGTTDFIFTVTLDAADPDDDILIDYTTTNGTATAGSDYTAASGTLTFAANTATLTQQITVTVTGDDVVEANETFTLDLSLNTANTGSAVISDAQGLGTILDDDTAGITISDVSAAEGNTAGTTDFIFTVTLDAADPDDDILIDYTTTNGTATAGSDYTAASGTLTFAANTATLTQQITVTVTGDDVVEANETFTLDLSLNTANTGSAVISDAQGLGTILDDDTAGITISDVSAAEGNTAGTTDFIFTVTLDAADPDDDILIDYTTTNGTATAGSDYTAASGTLTFAANTATLTQQITVTVTGDDVVEANETFTLDLSLNTANTGSAVISDAQGLGTILDDDTAGITISDVSAAEGNTAGTTDFIFTVTLDAADPDDDILIDYTTTNGTATAGSDYTAASGTLTFAANTATLTQQITVTVTGDDVVEANETFTLDLSLNTANTGSAVISDAQGLGTILDDDTAGITISDVSAAEGNTAGTTDFIFTVTLDAADPDDDILIDYTTTNGTATAGSDYTAASGTLTFAANTATLTQQITVTVTGDDVVEANETFTLDLSLNTANTGSAVISDAQGLGTILDDDTAGITISDVSAAEGNTAGTTDFIFTVTLDAADPDDDILIDYTTTNGTATAGSDYTAASGTLTFAANTATLTQQITVTVTGDDVVEANETFTLDLSLNTANTGSAVISDAQGLGTILDDDTAGITISDVSAAEGNTAGTTDFIFTVTLDAADPDDDILIDYTTTNGTATAGSDYTAASGTLTFAANTATLTQQITVTVTGDDVVEANETFTLDLSLNTANTGSAVISDAQGLGTILDDDTAGITISDVSAAEGNTAGTTDFIFTVTLDAADPDDDIRIDYTTTDGTATAGSDYTATSGTLTFAAGTATLTQQITVTVTGDDVVEADETFTLDLSLNTANTGSAVISDGQGLGTITNDDSAGITISDVTAAEGNSGTTDFIFTVTLDAADPDDDIRIDYTTTDGAAFDGSDYTATAGTLTFAAGTSTLSQQITVAVTGDALVEADETFTLDLSLNPANTGSAVISDGQGLGTITNDDSAGITISDVTAAEGNSGTTDFIFTVTLAAADPDDDIRIDYTTTDGAALDGSDYTATAGTLTFAAGTSTLSQQITVAVTGDALVEADETFTLDLSLNPANTGSAVISDGQGLGTITNDDSAGITISDVTAAEGNSGTTDFIFTVTLAAADPDDDIRIDYTTTDGAALDGSDYTATAGTLTFAAGTSTLSQQITVAVTGDALVEADETFTLDLSLNPANTGSAVISDGQGLGTITNDDSAGITISDVTAAEGNSGTTDFIFTVTLAAADPDDDIRIDYTTTDGAALDGSDYTATAGTLTFAAGTSTLSQQITVAVTGDALVEADETFTLDLSLNPANTGSAVISDGQGLGTITNDDSAGITISDVTAAEGNSGTTDFIFTVTLAAADPDDDIRIDYTTTDGAALDGSDYTATAGTLTFAAGTSTLSQQITVAVTGDALVEADETFTLDLSLNPANTGSAVISDGQGLGTIIDDDSAGVSVSAISGDTDESGTSATFSVVLTSQPTRRCHHRPHQRRYHRRHGLDRPP